MAFYIRQKPASWFWLVGIAITLWGVLGLRGVGLGARRIDLRAALNAHRVRLRGAAGAMLGGGIALLRKKRAALPLFAAAGIAALGQIVWMTAAPYPVSASNAPFAAVWAAAAGAAGVVRRLLAPPRLDLLSRYASTHWNTSSAACRTPARSGMRLERRRIFALLDRGDRLPGDADPLAKLGLVISPARNRSVRIWFSMRGLAMPALAVAEESRRLDHRHGFLTIRHGLNLLAIGNDLRDRMDEIAEYQRQ